MSQEPNDLRQQLDLQELERIKEEAADLLEEFGLPQVETAIEVKLEDGEVLYRWNDEYKEVLFSFLKEASEEDAVKMTNRIASFMDRQAVSKKQDQDLLDRMN